MIKIYLSAALTLLIGASIALNLYTTDNVQAVELQCPEGQRPSGGGLCRIEPTGCPLAEQTPIDECYVKKDVYISPPITQEAMDAMNNAGYSK